VARTEERIVVSEHARAQARRRGIDVEILVQLVRFPEQRVVIRPGREIRQSRIKMAAGGTLYLVRAVIDTVSSEATVVTVYRTSKIRKYWSEA
jgi:hypothetical protein